MDFSVGAREYRTVTMAARQQFHVARRLVPVVAAMKELIERAVNTARESGTTVSAVFDGQAKLPASADFMDVVMPIADAVAKLSDVDCDYVLDACLRCCLRKVGEAKYVAMWNTGANRLQFDDVTLPELMQIAANVIKENLTSFFIESPQTSSPAVLAQNAR